jgi:hypothetical protein
LILDERLAIVFWGCKKKGWELARDVWIDRLYALAFRGYDTLQDCKIEEKKGKEL